MATPPSKPKHPTPSQLLTSMAKLYFTLHPFSVAIIFFVMIPLVPFMLWIALALHFPSFQVTSVTVTSLTTTPTAELTASFRVNGILRNANILYSIWFESLDLALCFDQHIIASAPVESLPFSIGAKMDMPVEARFAVARKLFPPGVVKGIGEQRGRGLVQFGVTLHGRVRFWWAGIISYSGVHPFKVECNSLNVVFFPCSNNGTSSLVAPYDCHPI